MPNQQHQQTPSAAHTPAPWAIVPQTNGTSLIAREYATGKQMNPKGLRLVAFTMTRGDSLAEDEANARLISAAPDLLAAAHETVSAIEDEHRIHGRDDDYIYDTLGSGLSAAYFSARAAIARATGGAA